MSKYKVIKELNDGSDFVLGYIRPNWQGVYYFYPQVAGRRVSRKGRIDPLKSIPVWAQKQLDRVEQVEV